MKRSLLVALVFCGVVGAENPAPDLAKLTEQLHASDAATRRTAALQLGQLGPAAKDALPALIKALADSDKQVWSYAVGALAGLGPDAKDAIPALLDALDSRKYRGYNSRGQNQVLMRSAYALAQIGAAALPPLIAALSGDDTPLRIGAAKALGGMGPAAKDAIPALLANLGHGDADLRREVIEALAAIGPEAKPKLIEALAWNEPLQRGTAALALAQFGKSAGDAAPTLIAQLSKETETPVRASLLTALAKIGADPAVLVPLLLDGVKDEHDSIRHAAVNALLTARPASAVPALLALLRGADPALSQRAAYVLGRLGAKDAAAAIVEVAAKQSPPAAAYLDALVQLGEPAVPEILRALDKENPDALTGEHWSVKCLQSLGAPAVPALTRALANPSVPTRLAAARTLGTLGADAASAEPALLEALADADARVRGLALSALAAAKAAPKILGPRIEAALHDPAPAVRLAALALVPALEDGHPAVLAALHDTDLEVRLAALAIFVRIESDPAKKIPPLVAALEDKEPRVRQAAAAALGALGEKARESAAALQPLLADPDENVRREAGHALERIAPP